MKTVDVWRASLDRSADEVARLRSLLSEPEQDRASQFHREIDRSRYIAGRATLRILIGDYTSTAPELVPLCVLPNGKPALDARATPTNLRFNLSHSGGVALYAISAKPIGIDIQQIEENASAHRIAAHFFAPAEAAAFERMEDRDRQVYFFRTWTRKEAYLKATGQALGVDPSKVAVEDSAGGLATLTEADGSTGIDNRFRVYDVEAAPGHACAIAVEASICPPAIEVREWLRDNSSLALFQDVSARSIQNTDGVGFEPTVRY